MSEELLRAAADIRAENQEGANTAHRIGSLMEKMISEQDALRQRLPDPIVSPKVVDLSELDLMTSPDYALAGLQMPGAYYIVTRSTSDGQRKMVIGTLTVFSDSMMHALTQVFQTHELPDRNGQGFDGSHDHNRVQVWTRSYGLKTGSQYGPDSELYFPKGGWGKWHRTATPAAPDTGQPEPEDLRQEVARLKRQVAELTSLLTIS